MSLSTLNSPPLVAAIGGGIFALIPALTATELSLTTLQYANFLSYCINVGAVSVPGRIDGQQQQQIASQMEERKTSEMEQLAPGRNGKSLVAPSGWAFSIWGPIFLGELILVTSQLFAKSDDAIAPILKSASISFVSANIFQSLWCAAFRPKYKDGWMAVSTSFLASTAFSLSRVHTSFLGLQGWEYLIYGLPTTLHFGWTTAATLVNLNGAVAMHSGSSARAVAWIAHISVLAATALGVVVTISRNAPVYGGVICWALTAVADGMDKIISATKEDPDKDRKGVLCATFQRKLSYFGAVITGLTSAATTVLILLKGNNSSQQKSV